MINAFKSSVLTASIYWVILALFSYSYLSSGNPLSLSVVSDRVVDALSISLIFLVNWISKRPNDDYHSYGFHRVEALLNISVILLFVALSSYSAIITTEMLLLRTPISTGTTTISSLVTIPLLIIAGLSMDRDEKSNFRVMFLHTVQDLQIILVTLAFSLLSIYFLGQYLDYFGSYVVLIIILYGNRKLFRRNVNILLEGSPVSIREVEDRIKEDFPNAHHLHIWDICQHERVATLHLSVPSSMQIGDLDPTRTEIESALSRYGVNHVTVQFESNDSTAS